MPNTFKSIVATMPPRSHNPNGRFSIDDSQVIQWLIDQPRVKSYIFDKARREGLIQYDPHTKLWQGTHHN